MSSLKGRLDVYSKCDITRNCDVASVWDKYIFKAKRPSSWAECCFASTKTVGLLGTGAQDGHLEFHTVPELWPNSKCLRLYVQVILLCRFFWSWSWPEMKWALKRIKIANVSISSMRVIVLCIYIYAADVLTASNLSFPLRGHCLFVLWSGR